MPYLPLQGHLWVILYAAICMLSIINVESDTFYHTTACYPISLRILRFHSCDCKQQRLWQSSIFNSQDSGRIKIDTCQRQKKAEWRNQSKHPLNYPCANTEKSKGVPMTLTVRVTVCLPHDSDDDNDTKYEHVYSS